MVVKDIKGHTQRLEPSSFNRILGVERLTRFFLTRKSNTSKENPVSPLKVEECTTCPLVFFDIRRKILLLDIFGLLSLVVQTFLRTKHKRTLPLRTYGEETSERTRQILPSTTPLRLTRVGTLIKTFSRRFRLLSVKENPVQFLPRHVPDY